jgi:hypothetical protein
MSDKKPTYGKLPSQGFMNRNPRYRVAEHKLEGPREKKPEPGSSLDVHKLLNAGYSRDEAEYAASDARERGMRTAFGKTDLEPNRNLSPRERRRMGLDGNSGGTRTPTGPTDDQRKWARNFRESQRPITTSTKPTLPPTGISAVDMLTPQVSTATRGPAPAMNFSRSALVEGAKRSGDFDRVRGDYNRQSAAAQTGMRMNDRGSIAPLDRTTAGADGMTPYAREKFGPAVEDNRARRDFATGKSTTTSGTTGLSSGINSNPNADEMTPGTGGVRPTQAADFRREITSNYGRGSNVTRTDGQAGGKMSDPLTGRQVPIRQWGRDQTAVQDTKRPSGTASSSARPAQRSGGGSRK